MSDFTIVLLLMGFLLAAIYVWFYVDKVIERHADAIVTGILEGVPMSIEHRRYKLLHSWPRTLGGGVGYQSVVVVGLVLLARNVSDEQVQTFAYLIAFVAGIGVVPWIVHATLGYLYLSSVLRQAEAD